jgi:glycosyltransferase involved in cell wall biosynthesis
VRPAGSETHRPVVLVLLSYYLPGYKGGGPIRSISNMVEALGDELDFRIVTSDHDLGEKSPFPHLRAGQWVPVGKARVFYVPDTWTQWWILAKALIFTPADLVYLNSFFARPYSILALLLRRCRVFRPKSVLLAPRGEFSEGALRIKGWRKRFYIALARTAGLYGNVLWHASSCFEEHDIHNAFCDRETIAVAGPIAGQGTEAGRKLKVMTAQDMPGEVSALRTAAKSAKARGSIRLVFLSRISRKKNLDGAISMLRGLSGDVRFDIHGPVEDKAYWAECRRLIGSLPANIQVMYRGEARYDTVHRILSENDALLFPTHGENYGHIVREAFSAGCPVIVSDQTPWRNLEALGVGWDVALADTERFRTVIQECIDMTPEAFAACAARAQEYGVRLSSDPAIILQNRKLFDRALGRDAGEPALEVNR